MNIIEKLDKEFDKAFDTISTTKIHPDTFIQTDADGNKKVGDTVESNFHNQKEVKDFMFQAIRRVLDEVKVLVRENEQPYMFTETEERFLRDLDEKFITQLEDITK